MTPTPELEAAVERLKKARDAYTNVMQNWQTSGATEAGRRFSAGEANDTADEAMFEALADLKLEHILAVLASLPTGDMASRDHAPGEQRQAETETQEVNADLLNALRMIASQNPRPSNSSDKTHEHYLRSVLISIAERAIARAEGRS